ncbi:MAG: hypothetical protein WBA20_17605 [Ketobacter sp.]
MYLLTAMNYPVPGAGTRRRVERMLRMRARLLRFLPKHKYPQLSTLIQNQTHPEGYTVHDIGPDHLRQKWTK